MNTNKILILKFVILIAFVTISSSTFSQGYNQYIFENLQDEEYFPKIDKKVNEENFDSLFHIANSAFSFYYDKNEKIKAMYLFNVFAYNSIKVMPANKTFPFIQKKINFLKENNDTLNTQFAVLLEIVSAANPELNDRYSKKDKEISFLRRALKINEFIKSDSLQLGSNYMALAIKEMNNNDVVTGFRFFKKANKCFVSAGINPHKKIEKMRMLHASASYSGMAIGMQATGQVELALALSKKANIIQKKIEPYAINRAINEVNQAAYYVILKEYKKAIEHADFAEDLMAKKNYLETLRFSYIPLLRHRGFAYRELGDFEEAERNFRKMESLIIKYFGNKTPRLSYAYNEIALNFEKTQKYDSALYYYKIVKELDPTFSETNRGIAETYSKMNKFEKTIEYAKINMSYFLNNDTSKQQKEIPFADDFNERYLGFQSAFLVAKYYLSFFENKNDFKYLEKSIAYANLCDTLIGRHRDATMIGRDDENLAQEYHNIANLGIKAIYKAYSISNEEKYSNYFLRFFTNSTAFKLNAEVNQVDKNTSEQIKLLQKIRREENKLLALKNSNDTIYEIEPSDDFIHLKLEAFDLSLELQKVKNTNVSNDLFDEIKYEEIQNNLEKDEALTTYFMEDNSLYSIFIKKDIVKINSIAIGEDFDKLLKQYYKSLKTGSSKLKKYASEMYSFLISPYQKELKNIKNLIIIPDGELNQIPFEALVYEEGKKQKYLIEKLSISYNYSIFLWLRSRKFPKENEQLSFVGFAPVFSKDNETISENNPLRYDNELRDNYYEIRDGNSLKPLPYSGKEVVDIQRLFAKNGNKAKVFLKEKANEKNLKQNLSDYSIVHIATHGYSSKKDPKLSGLFMYNSDKNDSNNITNDGFVYLGEIFTMKPDANLVVLSACKSGIGKIAKGEGVVLALPRAFIFAGVPNLVASLWKVHDKKTKSLMIDFYKNIILGKSYSESLRQAKLNQIKKGELPIDWSSFILIGE